MTYQRPEALEIGSAEEVILGQVKMELENDSEQLPKKTNTQIAEMGE
jgi:hypothetical protein